MVRVNCGAAVRMRRVLLPRFAARRSGAVLNISSGSCNQPSPCARAPLSRVLRAPRESRARRPLARAQRAPCTRRPRPSSRSTRSASRASTRRWALISCVTPYYISARARYANRQGVGQRAAGAHRVSGAAPTLASASATERELAFGYNVHALMGFIFGSVPFAALSRGAPRLTRARARPRRRASPPSRIR